MGIGAAVALSQLPFSVFAETDPLWLNQPIGFQTYPIREMVVKDFPGTLKMMAGQGYQLVEMCSPQGYVTSGFGPLVNIKPAEMKRIIEDAGLHSETVVNLIQVLSSQEMSYGLVLQSVDKSSPIPRGLPSTKSKLGIYRRIGVFLRWNATVFETAPRVEVVIV